MSAGEPSRGELRRRRMRRFMRCALIPVAVAAIAPATAAAAIPQAGAAPRYSTSPTELAVSYSAQSDSPITEAELQYAPSGDNWCTSAGASGTPISVAVAPPDAFGFGSTHVLTGLTTGATYCLRLKATNASGNGYSMISGARVGLPATQLTAGESYTPYVRNTGPATSTVHGEVNPISSPTNYWVRRWQTPGFCGSPYDPSGKTDSTPQSLPFTDNAFHEVSVGASGLTPGQRYCFALYAANSIGDTLPAYVDEFVAGAPQTIVMDLALGSPSTTVAVSGTVNPAGQTTSYWAEYGLEDNGCTSSSIARTATSPVALGTTASAEHEVNVQLAGLQPSTNYCLWLRAENASSRDDDRFAQQITTGPGGEDPPSEPPPTPTPVAPAPAPAPTASTIASTSDGKIDSGSFRLGAVTCPVACTVTITGKAKLKKGGKTKAVGTGSITISAGKNGKPKLKLNAAAKKALKKAGKLKVTITVTVTSQGAVPVVKTYTVTVKQKKKGT